MSQTIPGTETRIRLVYPKLGQEIYEDSTFLMGQVEACPTDAFLEVDLKTGDKPVTERIPLSSHGFFAWKIPVHAGMNPLMLTVRQNAATPALAQELLALHGAEPFSVLPALPLAVHEGTLQPASNVWLTVQDALTVACSASVDAQVFLEIPGFLKQPIAIPPVKTEQPFLDTREPLFAQLHWNSQRIPTQGYYQRSISVRELLRQAGLSHLSQEHLDLPLILQLRHGEETLSVELPGRLSLLVHPRVAEVTQDLAVSRTAPVDGARLTPQRRDTQVLVDGLQQGWARVRLSKDESFYLPLDALNVEGLKGGEESLSAWDPHQQSVVGPLSLSSIHSEALGQNASQNSSKIKLVFSAPGKAVLLLAPPIQLEVIPSSSMNRLQVRLYGVCSRCDFIHYPANDAVVSQIHWRPVAEDVLELWIDLHQPSSGYDYAWRDGQWQLTVKVLPKRLADIKVLIDPGHGGAETGSIGLNSLPEKDLNLTASRLLRNALLGVGFEQVSLTRDTDEDLSLPARGALVQRTQADVVLSIHHNALPDGRDPLQAEGASCFYYQTFAKSLAQALLNGLTDNRGSRYEVPNYGLFYDSLYMTRIHQATAVLVEIGFFTNPTEFERLIDPEFQREAAQRLASAVRNYCLRL